MSLKNPDDDYDELIPDSNGLIGKLFSKNKKLLIILLVGIVLGCLLQYFVINDYVASSIKESCKTCLNSNELLSTENECLYTLVPEGIDASEECGKKQTPETTS